MYPSATYKNRIDLWSTDLSIGLSTDEGEAFQPDSLNRLASGTDVLLHLKLLQENQNAAAIQCIKLIMVRCELEQTVRQNLHFFYKCRCYLLYPPQTKFGGGGI